MDWFQHLFSWLLGILGGVTDLLTKDEFSWKKMLARGFVGGFAGYMSFLFFSSVTHFNPELLGFLSGMSGYLGPVALEFLARKFENITKIERGVRK